MRSQAVRRFLSLERSLHARNQFQEFSTFIEEYLDLGHAEAVPVADLPMHAVRKEHSTTTKVQAVFDVSKMYRAMNLAMSDRDLHCLVRRKSLTDTLVDYRMTRVTFGVSASSFAANMAVQQNALNLAMEYPQAAKIVAVFMWMMLLQELTQSKKPLSCRNDCSRCTCEVSFCANGTLVNQMF